MANDNKRPVRAVALKLIRELGLQSVIDFLPAPE
jgi:hypothetical protein